MAGGDLPEVPNLPLSAVSDLQYQKQNQYLPHEPSASGQEGNRSGNQYVESYWEKK